MIVLPVPTRLLGPGDDLAAAIVGAVKLEKGDIVVISSKAVARTEGRMFDLTKIVPTAKATSLSSECSQDPRLNQLVLDETKRMNGEIAGTSPYVLLTSLRPNGMTGRILCPNAGIDQSNVEKDSAIGWPEDAVASAKKLSAALKAAVIISDSCCVPGRLGVTAFALTCCGVEPLKSEVGEADLFGKKLRVTHEAVADQLATAANSVMGNAAQSAPAAVIRGSGLASSDFCGWVPGIEPEEDLFRGMI